MHSMAATVVLFLAVLMAGLVAGLLFGTVLEHEQLKVLPAKPWVLARQSIDAVFSRLMPWLWNTTLLLLAAAAYLTHDRARWLFAAAAAILLAGIVVTLVIEVPLNKQIASWTQETILPEWASVRDRWVRFHAVRTVAGVVAFDWQQSIALNCIAESARVLANLSDPIPQVKFKAANFFRGKNISVCDHISTAFGLFQASLYPGLIRKEVFEKCPMCRHEL